jgi:hypothetical protein
MYHVHQVINDDQVQVEYVDNEDYRTRIEFKILGIQNPKNLFFQLLVFFVSC